MRVVIGQTYHSEPVVVGVSGLTFTRDTSASASQIDGANVIWDPTYAEIGTSGIYLFSYVTEAIGFHTWVGSSSGGDNVGIAFNVVTAQQADPVEAVGLTSARVAKLDRIGSGTSVATSPVGADATILRIDRGDDYTGDNPIPFSEPSTGWPDLSDAQSVALLLLNRVNVAVLTVTGSVVNATPGAQTIAFEPTESQTGALNLGPHAYQFRVKAVLANGADRTLALGEVEVRA